MYMITNNRVAMELLLKINLLQQRSFYNEKGALKSCGRSCSRVGMPVKKECSLGPIDSLDGNFSGIDGEQITLFGLNHKLSLRIDIHRRASYGLIPSLDRYLSAQ